MHIIILLNDKIITVLNVLQSYNFVHLITWFTLICTGNLFNKDCVLALLCLVYAEINFVVW